MPSVAILGASNQPAKYGHAAVLAFRDAGWTVWPVNPRESGIDGLPVFSSLSELPGAPDWISVYLPPAVGLTLLPALRAAGAEKIWLNPGSDNVELVAAAERLGLSVALGCSIRAIGKNPADYFPPN